MSSIGQKTDNNFDSTSFNKGLLWLLLSFFCGAIVFTVSKYILSNMFQTDFFCWWYGSALIYHTLYGILKGSISLENIGKKYLVLFALYIVLDLSGTYCFFLSIKMMDPSIVSFFSQSQIIFTLFFGFLILREVLNKGELGAAIIIISGIVIMTYNSGSVPFIGTLLMLYANITGSINLVIVRKIGCHVGTLTFARIRTISLFTFFLCYNLYSNGKIIVPPVQLLVFIIAGSFFGPFLNVISIYKSLEYITVGKIALYRSIQPLFVMAVAGIFLKTFPGIRALIGGMIMILGSIVLAYFHAVHVIGLKRPLRALR